MQGMLELRSERGAYLSEFSSSLLEAFLVEMCKPRCSIELRHNIRLILQVMDGLQ